MKKNSIRTVIFIIFVIFFILIVLFPFYWMIVSSISPQVELTEKPPHWIPQEPSLKRFVNLLFGGEGGNAARQRVFVSSLITSVIVSVSTTIICLVTGTMAAYALARIRIAGVMKILVGILIAQMIPMIVIVIPLFLFLKGVGLYDSRLGLSIVFTGLMLPTVIWIMFGYLKTIPTQLEEAAIMDGCSPFAAMVRIVIPLSVPGLVAVGAFTFLNTWNNFFVSLVLTASRAKPLTVVITEFSSQFGIDYGLMATGGVIGCIPPILLTILLQKHIVSGLTAGAVKG
ncbi:MAG: carbohydrate ABC transporter permease [Spirochaetales bacterium]|nr:carbohydrate ABC transporter permease [Spirochaetales bacterium]